MFFKNAALRFAILLTITALNTICSSMPLTFLDTLNAETKKVVDIGSVDQPAFQEFFNALNFTEGGYAKERAKCAFVRVPVASHLDFIITVNTLPNEMSNYRKANFVSIFSIFPPTCYQQIRDLVGGSNEEENIESAVLRFGRSFFDGIDDSNEG